MNRIITLPALLRVGLVVRQVVAASLSVVGTAGLAFASDVPAVSAEAKEFCAAGGDSAKFADVQSEKLQRCPASVAVTRSAIRVRRTCSITSWTSWLAAETELPGQVSGPVAGNGGVPGP